MAKRRNHERKREIDESQKGSTGSRRSLLPGVPDRPVRIVERAVIEARRPRRWTRRYGIVVVGLLWGAVTALAHRCAQGETSGGLAVELRDIVAVDRARTIRHPRILRRRRSRRRNASSDARVVVVTLVMNAATARL